MMTAGGRHLECPLGRFLALDVPEIGQLAHLLGNARLRPRQDLRALHMIEDLDDRLWADDIDLLAGPCSFRSARLRADEAEASGVGGDRCRQRAGDGAQSAIEPHFADHDIAVEKILGQHAQGRKHRERDGEIIVAAFLGEIGG